MALGTLTKANATKGSIGPYFSDRVTIAGDGAYPTGGSTGLQTKLRALFKDQRTIIGVAVVSAPGYTAQYNAADDKLLVYRSAGSAAAFQEVPNATDLSGVTFDLLVTSELPPDTPRGAR